MLLENKIAAVTGGSAGIGRGIAEAYLREGAKVAILARNAEKADRLIQELNAGYRIVFVQGDATIQESVEGFIDKTISTFGTIDILVNNAGGAGGDLQPTVSLTDEEFDFCIKINLYATFWGIRHALKTMLPKQSGRIINISSVHGLLMSKNAIVYESGKSAVIGMTKQMACDFGPLGVRVNAICPGHIVTEKMEVRWKEMPKGLKFFEEQYPVRRTGVPEDIANGIMFLLSDQSKYITGTEITIDGGITAKP